MSDSFPACKGIIVIVAMSVLTLRPPLAFGQADDNNTRPPAATTTEQKQAATESKPARYFRTSAGVSTIACSPDGEVVAFANGSPTLVMQANGTSRPKDQWRPTAETLDTATRKMIALQLTTDEEDAVLAATERISHFQVQTLALSPGGNLVAVGTSIGQVKLFDARTGEAVRSLDDQPARLADKQTPENWKSLQRAMGSVRSIAFSPDGSQLAMCGDSFADFARVFDRVDRLGERGTGPGRVKVWEVETGRLQHDLVGHSHADAVIFSSDGSLLASAGRWLSDREAGIGAILWNSHTGAKLRTIATGVNGATDAVAFSPDAKLIAISSLHFDQARDGGARVISLANVDSGVVQWRRTASSWAKPVGFYSGGVAVLHDGRGIRLLNAQQGETLLGLVAQSAARGRLNDFALAKRGGMIVFGGVDHNRKGVIEIWDY